MKYQPTKEMEHLWNSEQTANYLGKSKKALYLMVYRGQIPVIKMGTNNSSLRFDPVEIRAYVDAHRVRAFKGV